ncbi:alpha/beta fold hydrolase [Amnibacterium kyonggiense]|uniref:Alpha-beta hydrolase superfamily lysophospholipase n=1 Tax=Amnibacterium kyonggiense TaxID=595671 RepID=A0A4R7FSF2_9MICO|nr:alpha/beta hydrolase [Amnibacterium kyonggiense]TDS80795.1 alpha-beta hydrolase superfamily lysophospholipase [Amnibacterium kyonggiense]
MTATVRPPLSASIREAPAPQFVMAPDAVRIATYDVGDEGAPVVLAVHGFASSAQVNWFDTGWVRELVRAGYRIVALDQRGHGSSDKPHDAGAYSMQRLVADVVAVLDAYLLDEVALVGYSLGARVGWHAALDLGRRISHAVLGGIPDGQPLTRFRVDDALEHLRSGAPVEDRITRAYIEMAARTPTNDLAALVALVAGMQGGLQPDPARPPRQPVLFATGSEDAILPRSQRLAAGTPNGEFFEIPGRNHFNAPTSRPFRGRALAFLEQPTG